ncbi:DUF6471 domain-containing protein [Novimethylophilus kurashikiensis]|uniref:DUF6471 domain-containing protein n=1 Tax=Novimethylophilus kurashikiensis TaxID=1825523 RepID=UPI0015E81C6A|nr:DUF6471 domain-containing protein [Novimethylophilus kurashikiensis]
MSKPQSEIQAEWEAIAYELLVKEMGQRHITYKMLSQRLALMGIAESPDRLNRKVNRRKFSTAFFLACCQAMEVESVPLGSFLRLRQP